MLEQVGGVRRHAAAEQKPGIGQAVERYFQVPYRAAELQARLEVCGLQMHPTKTLIVYCKDNRRRRTYPNVKFDFLGYQFRPRRVAPSQRTEFFCGYTPAVSPTALKSMRATIRSLHIPRQTSGTL